MTGDHGQYLKHKTILSFQRLQQLALLGRQSGTLPRINLLTPDPRPHRLTQNEDAVMSS
ncbi:MAG: hypothetical protein IPK13_09765 [Deltaproteobacteria bacterium]|nr:hypothetical protein [Deltaproteobacteria bacterium]